MDIEELVKQELKCTLHRDNRVADRWVATLIPVNLWSVSEWPPIQAELHRLLAAGFLEDVVVIEGEGHDDDDVVYPVLTPAGLTWLETD